jgi:hypothetical protein
MNSKQTVFDEQALERVGKAIYLGLYANDGARWEANDMKHLWRDLARTAIDAYPEPGKVAVLLDEADIILLDDGDSTVMKGARQRILDCVRKTR